MNCDEFSPFDSEEFNELKSESQNSEVSLNEQSFVSDLREVDILTAQKTKPKKKKNKTHKSNKKKYTSRRNSNHLKDEKKSREDNKEPINYNSYEYHKKQHTI